MPLQLFDRIVQLINDASLAEEADVKVTKLLQVNELIIHQESSLLDNFFEVSLHLQLVKKNPQEVAAFQHDNSLEVRKVVIKFIESACQVDPSLLKKAIGYLFFLFSAAIQQDPPAHNLICCITTALKSIYRMSLTRAVKVGIVESGVTIVSSSGIPADSAADVALETFRSVAGLKDEIIRLMLPQAVPGQSAFGFLRPIVPNDPLRLIILSFVETLIVLHSRRLPNSVIPPSNEGDISLDQIPDMTNVQLQSVLEASTASSSATLLPGVCLVRPRRLNEEAERMFTGLLDWPIRGKSSTSNGPISCTMLDSIMDSLVTIAKQRPQFLDRVVQAFETVHVTLPPHFSDVQVSSVRRTLKSGLLQLLRHPAAIADYQGRITILLTDLGATQNEVVTALQRQTDFNRTQTYSDPGAHPTDSVDHGDVDMRQLPTGVGKSLSSTQVPGTTPSHSTTEKSGAVPRHGSANQVSLSTEHPDTHKVGHPMGTSLTSSFGESRLHASGNLLAEAEAALQFDDDDDDDDDMQIIRSRTGRRPRIKRQSNTTTTTTTSVTSSKTLTSVSTELTKCSFTGNLLTKSSTEPPSVDFVTMRLVPRLTAANVADLVLLSMVTLPDQMPATFQSTYTPIAAAGTSAQIRHLARMLAVQLVVWTGESKQNDLVDNMSQLESLLRPSQDELEAMAGPGIKRNSKSDSGDLTGLKETSRGKKRRLANAAAEKSDAGADAEAEDAMIRANAARRMQPMNISTLISWNQQQPELSIIGTTDPLSLSQQGLSTSILPGLPAMFPNVPSPTMGIPVGSTVPAFNLSQPPPPMSMLAPVSMPTGVATFQTLGVATTNQTPVSVPLGLAELMAPLPARPFSLDAITAPLGRQLQRQLARDAFLRVLEGLEDPIMRRSSVVTAESQIVPLGGVEPSSTVQQLSRMKILTRLTTRRFGGNEFYNVLIEYAIKNLRYGFELLCKLLMQEYCRFRGFQLVGFGPFIKFRREQLEQLKQQHQQLSQRKPSMENSKLEVKVFSATDEGHRSSDSRNQNMAVKRQRSSSVAEDVDNDSCLMVEDNIELLEGDDTRLLSDRPSSPSSPTTSENNGKVAMPNLSEISHSTEMMKSETHQTQGSHQDNKTRVVTSPDDLGCLSFYDCLLIDILQRLAQPDVRQNYFGRFLIEAPLLTTGALSVLKRYCWTVSNSHQGFQVLRTLIEIRPVAQREDLLNMLLNFCSVMDTEVRQAALAATRELSSLDTEWQKDIEVFAISSLKKLLQPHPSADIYPFNMQTATKTATPAVPTSWNDEASQACAHLFLGLMPQNPSLMHELANVYVDACPDVKRAILRMIDTPIREIGLYSRALHELVEHCPIGAETLITRMIHLLTDSPSAAAATVAAAVSNSTVNIASVTPGGTQKLSLPSLTANAAASNPIIPFHSVIIPPASLVQRVYALYRDRVHDIRCVIPVLVGLSKHEVIMALPRLVQLSEKVVKEVLTRLLHASVATQYAQPIEKVDNVPFDFNEPAPLGPLKPEELMVAIHLLEFAKDPTAHMNDASTPSKPCVSLQSILHACRICFAERRLFTQERLSAAIGQMLEQPTLPTLFMRTVMQALALHPRLAGYVINVLVRLIRKQVWKSEKLWDGFIRCCVKTRPQSYQVLLQLPPERLEVVFQQEPGIRTQVRRYVENFSSAQRIHISKAIIEVLERDPTPSPPLSPIRKHQGESAQAPISVPASPSSSGPGTPTRDEMLQHNIAATLATAASLLQQPLDEIVQSNPEPIPPANVAPLSVIVGGRAVGGDTRTSRSPPIDEFGRCREALSNSSQRDSRQSTRRECDVRRDDRNISQQTGTREHLNRTEEKNRKRKVRCQSPFEEVEQYKSSRHESPLKTIQLNLSSSTSVDFTECFDSRDNPNDCQSEISHPVLDDLEPPTLPPTKIGESPLSKSVSAISLISVPTVSTASTAELLEAVDQSPLDWSTEDPDEVIQLIQKPKSFDD